MEPESADVIIHLHTFVYYPEGKDIAFAKCVDFCSFLSHMRSSDHSHLPWLNVPVKALLPGELWDSGTKGILEAQSGKASFIFICCCGISLWTLPLVCQHCAKRLASSTLQISFFQWSGSRKEIAQEREEKLELSCRRVSGLFLPEAGWTQSVWLSWIV